MPRPADRTPPARLAGAGRRAAEPAYEVPFGLVGVVDAVPPAARAPSGAEHAGIDEPHEPPGPGGREQRFDPGLLRLRDVELVGTDDRLDVVDRAGLDEVLVQVVEQ